MIDFGGSAVGDMACDLMPAWSLFDETERGRFFGLMNPSSQGLRRGRGWALTVSVVAYAYYRRRNAYLARVSRHCLEQLSLEAAV